MSLPAPSLLGLPLELIQNILYHLIDDKDTLKNMCLVGNHTLLENVRPLTWHELNISCDVGTVSEPHPLAQPLLEFSEDPVKAAAVRLVTIKLTGFFHPLSTIWKPLLDALAKFINATHAYLLSFELHPYGGDGTWLVKWVIESMPALVSIRIDSTIEGCNMGVGDSEKPIKPRSKSFQAIDTRYCDIDVHFLWEQTPNIKVLEIQAGHISNCGIGNGIGDGQCIKWGEYDSFDADALYTAEYHSFDAGAHYALEGPMADSLVRLCVRGNHGREHRGLDIKNFAEFCRNLGEPCFPLLEELVVDMAFDIEEYPLLLAKFAKPTIRILLFSLDTAIGEADVVSMFENLASSGDCPFERYLSLKEFWVPHEGTSESLTAILPNFLSAAPALESIYFDHVENTTQLELVRIAETYAKSIHTLQCVSWCCEAAIKINRDENGELHGVVKEYVTPSWLQFRGVGPWWEYDPGST